jgi:hypothetical protein
MFLSISTFSSRHALFLWFLLAVFLLPLAFWFRLGFTKLCIAFLVVATGLAMSPIDFTIKYSGKRGLHLLPISYGIGCAPGTACYGCIIPPTPLVRR